MISVLFFPLFFSILGSRCPIFLDINIINSHDGLHLVTLTKASEGPTWATTTAMAVASVAGSVARIAVARIAVARIVAESRRRGVELSWA